MPSKRHLFGFGSTHSERVPSKRMAPIRVSASGICAEESRRRGREVSSMHVVRAPLRGAGREGRSPEAR